MARRLIFDTSALVWAERHPQRLEGVVAPDDDLAVAAITVAELEVGVELAEPRYRAAHRRFVDGLLLAAEVIPYDLVVARRHAELMLAAVRREGRPRGAHDLIIAATAAATERAIVTADLHGLEALPGVVVRTLTGS